MSAMPHTGHQAARENTEVELWMTVGGTGVNAHRYCTADFVDEVIEVRVGWSFHVSTDGVIPDSLAAPFWQAFWEGISPRHKKAFSAALEDALRALLRDHDVDEWMERADSLIQARFEECGGRALEVPRQSVADEELDSDLDVCRAPLPVLTAVQR